MPPAVAPDPQRVARSAPFADVAGLGLALTTTAAWALTGVTRALGPATILLLGHTLLTLVATSSAVVGSTTSGRRRALGVAVGLAAAAGTLVAFDHWPAWTVPTLALAAGVPAAPAPRVRGVATLVSAGMLVGILVTTLVS